MIAKVFETKACIIFGIISILLISYIWLSLTGIIYNKLHGKPILGRKYRLLSFSLCTVLSIVCIVLSIVYLGAYASSIKAAAVGSLIGICIVDIVLVGLNLFSNDPEADKYFYTEYWAKGCPSDQPRYNIYIGGEPLFEKRKSDGKVVFRKRRTEK